MELVHEDVFVLLGTFLLPFSFISLRTSTASSSGLAEDAALNSKASSSAGA
ncbi:MAG: hypothetical protein ACR2N0_16980 [Rubrobacteraceae bacterium]